MTSNQTEKAQLIQDFYGIKISELTPILKLRHGYELFGTDDGYFFLTDGDRCETMEDHADRMTGSQLCKWNASTKQFERI